MAEGYYKNISFKTQALLCVTPSQTVFLSPQYSSLSIMYFSCIICGNTTQRGYRNYNVTWLDKFSRYSI